MARIRSIKPEFPQSESMGNVSRDARLTFIMLWTLADDEGRLRGNSRMLASLLFPYDADAGKGIDKWLAELEAESCIIRYKDNSASYVQVCKWLIHQKIDRPSRSKIPPPPETSREFANDREDSSTDQGSRIKDQGRDQGKDQDRTDTAERALAVVGSQVERRKSPRASMEVQEVFDYWKQAMRHPSARLDDKRAKAIGQRLADGYTVGQLCQAVDGCRKSPYHMGQNDSNTIYDDIELICRNTSKVESFINRAGAAASGINPGLQSQIDTLQAWMEEE